ncbi:histone-lysine N-methyltransferase SETMAR-like [Oratosquilla oratoria]|uniref:histone-lysine N-methyltransferase SETMAR-like n=1 Tax=Oratosquilla oratoria TaxID=337810 RepID=UPI003F768A36
MTERTAQKWFKKFRSGSFNLEDAPCSGRPSGFDEDALNQLICEDPRQSTRELEQAIRYNHAIVARHLQKMVKVQKLGAWVPHTLKDSHKNQRVSISTSLLPRHQVATEQHRSFLSCVMTGDEKLCLYLNKKQKKDWGSPTKQPKSRVKPEVHQTKVLLSVWWAQSEVVHHELLPKKRDN